MAEAIYNHLAKPSKATSAGTFPAKLVDPLTVRVLKEVGIELKNTLPRQLKDTDLEATDLIVSFGCLIPSMFPKDKFQEWHVKDAQTLDEFRLARDQITEKVKELIEKS